MAQASDFPADSLGGTLFADLGATVIEIESLASTQGSSISASRQGTESKTLAREVLIEEMEAIGLIAGGLALETPGLENKFRPSRNLSDTDLLTLARSFLSDATPLAADFIRHGTAKDFPKDLTDAIGALAQAVTEREHNREHHVSATASFDPLLAQGMKQLKHLNTVVRTVYRHNEAMLAAWTSASHIHRPSRKEKSPKPPSAEPNPAEPASKE